MPEEERIITTDDGSGAGAAYGASALIRTIVWSVVVLILLGIGIFLLYRYGIL
jgi:hypothetical protein